MSIYTKSGDKGETGLLGGKRISKSSPRIEAIGSVDELNAALGVLRAQAMARPNAPKNKNYDKIFQHIQNDLFAVGMELADTTAHKKTPVITEKHAHFLEQHIDNLEKKLPQLKQFILPGGTLFSAQTHMARAVCRRAERRLVSLAQTETISRALIIYLNRLSDLLFMLARADCFDKKVPEQPWKKPL